MVEVTFCKIPQDLGCTAPLHSSGGGTMRRVDNGGVTIG